MLRLHGIERLAAQHRSRGDAALAEPLLREALAIAEDIYRHDELRLAARLNALGLVCKDLAKYDEARALYERALSLLRQAASGDDEAIATLYHNLGGIEHARRNYAAGEPFARAAVELRTQLAGAEHPTVAADMVALAAILDGLGRCDEAEGLYVEALRILERAPEENALEIAVTLNDLGAQYVRRGLSMRAEALLERAVTLKKRTLGARHPDVAVTINNLALLYRWRGDFARARQCYEEAIPVLEESLGADHPKSIACRANYVRSTAGKAGEASLLSFEERVDGTRSLAIHDQHPTIHDRITIAPQVAPSPFTIIP
jgi:tetratricopeptide (TPR) repeat protein